MKNSQLLRSVKKNLWSGARDLPDPDYWRRYICTSITALALHEAQARELREWVMSLLGGSFALEAWLTVRGIDIYGLCSYNHRKLQATRKAWLDWMIAYWEAQGN